MNHRLGVAMRLVLMQQWRARFPHVYFGVAVLAIVVFRTAIPSEWIPYALPAFLFGEPGSLGIMMVAALRYLDRGERSVVALMVTPLRAGEYVSGLILASAVAPVAATALVQIGVLGVDVRVLLVLPPLAGLAIVSGGIGLILSTVFQEFTRFIIGTIPPILIYSLPLVSFFGIAPWWVFVWVPSHGALTAFGMLAGGDVHAMKYVGSVGMLAVFAAATWWAAVAVYDARVRREIEFA